MNTAQKRTLAAVKLHVIEALERAAQDDETLDAVECKGEKLGTVDTSACDAAVLCSDKQLQAAFKKFVSQTIGAFQYVEEEFGPNAEE